MASAVIVAAVRARLPALASTATYPDVDASPFASGIISTAVDTFAAPLVGLHLYGVHYSAALVHAAAHYLASSLTVTAAASGGTVGSVTSATAGPQGITLAGAALARAAFSDGDAYLASTVHGQNLLTLRGSRAGNVPRCV
jgi:hypothetical protein